MVARLAHAPFRLSVRLVAEWLFFEDDPQVEAERRAYEQSTLPLRRVNIRSKRLNKLDKSDVAWVYRSHDGLRSLS